MKVYSKIDELIGKTPLLDVSELFADNKNCKILSKLEFFNPAGSVKDRAVLYMLNQAEKEGKIKQGGTIIEPTSGNTGIGLAAIGVSRGYNVVLTMPDTMSIERRKILSALGAKVVLTDGAKGMKGAIDKAEEIFNKTENAFIPSQFSNPNNALAHYHTTGPEIWKDTLGKVDYLVACVGSAGTIVGTAEYLKEQNKNIKVVAIEPENSKVLRGEKANSHKIQGIGANFIPENYKAEVVDQIIDVLDEDAFLYAKNFALKTGLLVGISSGAALKGVEKLLKENNIENKTIVVILPDGGERYLSSNLYD